MEDIVNSVFDIPFGRHPAARLLTPFRLQGRLKANTIVKNLVILDASFFN